jgi:MoxR-like ATPase
MKADAKFRRIQEVAGWKLAADPPNLSLLNDALTKSADHGSAGWMPSLMNPGQFYLTQIPHQISFYLDFAREVIENEIDTTKVEECKRIASSVQKVSIWGQQRNCNSARHILLHLLFPDLFERMAADDHKRNIIRAFAAMTAGATDPDDAILNIRKSLEVGEFAGKWVDFYGVPEIRNRWRSPHEPDDEATADDDDLSELADLLNNLMLEDQDVRRHAWWSANIKPITRPFLQHIRAQLDAADVKFHTGGDANAKRESFDKAHVALVDRGGVWHPDTLRAFVSVGYKDEIGSEPNLEKCLVWGLEGYPKPNSTVARKTMEELSGPSYAVREVDGMAASPWAGRYVIATKSMSPDEIRQRRASDLHAEIASDLQALLTKAGARAPDQATPPNNRMEALARETFMQISQLREIEALLRDKQHIILEGPPGSGKTFVANKFARYFTQNGFEGDRDQRMEILQFHQSYGYEDFVQGIRPTTDPKTKQIGYSVEPGVFKRFCDVARQDPEEKEHVIILDEINRGNVARIFGELLFLLEYRAEKARLPYSGEEFSIPKNVYLIGTMNTTDRSLALIDYALRRRFYFYPLKPVADSEAPVLSGWLTKNDVTNRDTIIRLFVRLNEQIEGQLDEHHQVGHSYLMRKEIGDPKVLHQVWRRAIIPLLEEYFHPRKTRVELEAEFGIEVLGRVRDGSPPDDEES